MLRSLRVAPEPIQKVKLALKRKGFPSQQALAREMGMARATISNFVNGKPVDFTIFVEICERLGLDWQEIANIGDGNTPRETEQPSYPLASRSEPEAESTSTGSDGTMAQTEEEFIEAARNWDLERLYADLEAAKREWGINKRWGLTTVEKQYLQGLLCGYSPDEIATKLDKDVRLVRVQLSNNLYRYVEKLLDRPANSLENWRDIVIWLAEAGYRLNAQLEQHLRLEKQKSEAGLVHNEEVIATPSIPNRSFLGREKAIAHLNTRVNQGAKVILIQASGGVGKTTLAQEYLHSQGFDLLLELLMAKEKENITPVESVIEEWLKRDFQEEPGREFGVTLGRLKRQLQTRRVGVLIDNLEPALNRQGKFIESHRRYVELLRVLADSSVQSVTLITSRESLAECVGITNYSLPSLDEQAWQDFFSCHNIDIDATALKEMHKAYGGNALAMTILCESIQRDGGIVAYRREHKVEAGLLVELAVENLVKEQFNRLEKIYPEAYRLLCRLGCYRYQDVPTVPIEGLLYLLWDVPEPQCRRVIESLRNRSLVECYKGEYWLHPVIRAEALNRLRQTEDWEITHRKVAEFWTESIKTIRTVEDAIKALEACFHYIEVKDFKQAGAVLVQERNNNGVTSDNVSSSLKSSLIGSFFRLGLLQTISTVLTLVVPNIYSNSILCKLYNKSGENYWRLGSLIKAIKQYEKSRKIALEQGYKYLEIDSLYNIGRCQVELWELEEAKKVFEEVIQVSENTEWHTRSVCASFYLAFLYACLGFKEKSVNLADKINREILVYKLGVKSTGLRLFFLGLTYKKIGKQQQAFELFKTAYDYAKQVEFTQLLAQVTNGLAELYREKNNFELAVTNHLVAIEILDNLGAQSNLAEAYYQLGLTYQEIDNYVKRNEYISRAVQIFHEIEAPKQVERARRSLKA
ncbi:MAG: tetratricopeptide repeat protein [Microcoleus sp. PH2017_15_JOR_U_A]|uniref:tetratricopeptide repeat protein n=1 Tax=Microcoleus sp. PH2017_15_JOR_U_A TaxID=2798826 RepID=UPI001DAF1C1C|nr:tetratricopeptide repeat protein [Microcoleus sp. PH2017_15_JOR_U_A]MCC3509541.1 tetratricopeptide repeat protein [Microcoleus sp. PH2017_17_BER_D_A]